MRLLHGVGGRARSPGLGVSPQNWGERTRLKAMRRSWCEALGGCMMCSLNPSPHPEASLLPSFWDTPFASVRGQNSLTKKKENVSKLRQQNQQGPDMELD